VFVLGDNRPESSDSRAFGPIDTDKIRGRAFVVLWPVGNWSWL
jgi:signal peptidase I